MNLDYIICNECSLVLHIEIKLSQEASYQYQAVTFSIWLSDNLHVWKICDFKSRTPFNTRIDNGIIGRYISSDMLTVSRLRPYINPIIFTLVLKGRSGRYHPLIPSWRNKVPHRAHTKEFIWINFFLILIIHWIISVDSMFWLTHECMLLSSVWLW